MELTTEFAAFLKKTAATFSGFAKREFMAEAVNALGKGGQRAAENVLGWCRNTIRKGQRELKHNIRCVDNFQARGRKPAESHLPNLLGDMREIVEDKTQTDPSFKSTRLYTRMSAPEVRKQLLQKGYSDEELPAVSTIGRKLNKLGFHLKRVQKVKPKKKSLKPTLSLLSCQK